MFTGGAERVCRLPAEQSGWIQRMEGLKTHRSRQKITAARSHDEEHGRQVRDYLQEVVHGDIGGRTVSSGPDGEQRGLQFGVRGQRHLQELGVDRPL